MLISRRPRVIIREGVIDQKPMRQIRFTLDDLMENLRGQGIFDVQDVWHCVVETNGKVNVLQRFPAKNLTPEDMQIKGSDSLPPVVIISDGELLTEAMRFYNISKEWVDKILLLKKKKVSEIFLMTVDGDRNYLLVEKEGKRAG